MEFYFLDHDRGPGQVCRCRFSGVGHCLQAHEKSASAASASAMGPAKDPGLRLGNLITHTESQRNSSANVRPDKTKQIPHP